MPLFKSNKEPSVFKPLMPRNPKEVYHGISLDEYLNQRKKDKLLITIQDMFPLSDEERLFDDKLQYLIDTVSDMTGHKKEILDLWPQHLISLKENQDELLAEIRNDTFPLISITGEAGLEEEENKEIIIKLENLVKDILTDKLNDPDNFSNALDKMISWYYYLFKFAHYLKTGIRSGEIAFFKNIVEQYASRIENIKSLSPTTFINFAEIIKTHYKNLQSDNKVQYRSFFLSIALQQIIVARNSGDFSRYGQLLEDYYSVQLNNKTLNWSFKNLVGYGEQPWKLLIAFIGINILFAIIFTVFPFAFEFKPAPENQFYKFCQLFYFNNTTMLTIGYGDIAPIGPGARGMVILLQLLGFSISSAAVALFLRRILRF